MRGVTANSVADIVGLRQMILDNARIAYPMLSGRRGVFDYKVMVSRSDGQYGATVLCGPDNVAFISGDWDESLLEAYENLFTASAAVMADLMEAGRLKDVYFGPHDGVDGGRVAEWVQY